MSHLSIRAFKPNDQTEVINLWVKCGLVVPHNDPAKDIELKQHVNNEWFFVGEVEGRIVATCMVGYEGHRGCVNYLAVDPDYQGSGIGRSIMEKAEEVLIEVGCPKINLLVRSTNTQVLDFYETLGYSDNNCISLGKRLIQD